MMAFDLNMPPMLSLESEMFQSDTVMEYGAKADYDDNSDSESIEYQNRETIERESKLYKFELNSYVDEDESSPVFTDFENHWTS